MCCNFCKNYTDQQMKREDDRADIQFEISRIKFLTGEDLKLSKPIKDTEFDKNYYKKLNNHHNERLNKLKDHYV